MTCISIQKLVDRGFDIYTQKTFGSITIRQVRKMIERLQLTGERLTVPYSDSLAKWDGRDLHVRRIATLAIDGWPDAIEIDVGIPSLNYHPEHPVADGNHRLAAAIARGDKDIQVDFAGDVDYAEELFGVRIVTPE